MRLQIRNLGGLAQAITNRLYQAPPNTIGNVNPNNFPTVAQPVTPMAPAGSNPLVNHFTYGQNLNYTPRPDAIYTAADLKTLSMYPLSRICIDNTKDALCQMEWKIELRQLPGETEADVSARRKRAAKGDENIVKISRFIERPNPESDWSEWIRQILEDMLVIDGASTFVARKKNNSIDSLWWTPGEYITRYLDDMGRTPQPPYPAYAQLWEGIPRVNLTTAQLIYKPRNIVPRVGILSSYLYGCSPTESVADELKVGISRLTYILAYYDEGSVGNMIHVAPPTITADKIEEATKVFNSQLAGQLGRRRQYTILQGFQTEGKKDQLEFPKEPVMADLFDDLHIRKIAFAFGTSPQRLQRAMNRSSAQASQQAAQEEGIRPWMDWVRRFVNYIIQVKMGYTDYEINLTPYFESDVNKQAKIDQMDVHEGIRTRNEIRARRGDDPITDNPMANQLTTTTANGVVPLGQIITAMGGGGDVEGEDKAKSSSLEHSKKVRLIERGQIQ